MSEENKTTVKLTIDGQEVEVTKGTNLIHAAEKIGKTIPHFCYHEGLPVAGQCRMCFVEVEGARKLATACSTAAGEGMVVKTDETSEEVKKSQNATLEFTLLHHPLDCPICDRGGECKLQDFTYDFGLPNSRLADDKRTLDKNRAISDNIILDQERCILCTRCVRFSQDVDGASELGIMGRGSNNKVDIFDNTFMQSEFSGNVVDLCPVGALTAKDYRFEARPWELQKHDSVCQTCSMGCNVEAHTKTRHSGIPRPDGLPPIPQVKRLVPKKNTKVNDWWMCDQGRWSYHFHNEDEKRIIQPSLARKENEKQSTVSLNEIQEYISQHKEWNFWIDGSLSHESLDWILELKKSWNTRSRQVSINPHPFAHEFLETWKTMSSAHGEIELSSVKNVFTDLKKEQIKKQIPILYLKLSNQNVKWNSLDKAETNSQNSLVILELARNTSELKDQANKVNLLKIPTLFMFKKANSRGLLDRDIVPLEVFEHLLNDKQSHSGTELLFRQSNSIAPSETLITFFKDRTFGLHDSFHSEISKNASFILPATPVLESNAHFTNLLGLKQHAQGIQIHHPNYPAIAKGGPAVHPALRTL